MSINWRLKIGMKDYWFVWKYYWYQDHCERSFLLRHAQKAKKEFHTLSKWHQESVETPSRQRPKPPRLCCQQFPWPDSQTFFGFLAQKETLGHDWKHLHMLHLLQRTSSRTSSKMSSRSRNTASRSDRFQHWQIKVSAHQLMFLQCMFFCYKVVYYRCASTYVFLIRKLISRHISMILSTFSFSSFSSLNLYFTWLIGTLPTRSLNLPRFLSYWLLLCCLEDFAGFHRCLPPMDCWFR